MAALTHKIQKLTLILVHVTTLTGLILMGIWCGQYLGGFSTKKGQQFNWHPFLMYFGFMVCFGYAATSYRLLPFTHAKKKLFHLIFQTVGIVSVSLGLTAVVRYHKDNRYPDFYSLHSWLGIFVFALFCLQYVGSVIAFFWPKLPLEQRKAFLPMHVVVGGWLYVAAGSVCLLGMQEKLGFLGSSVSCATGSTSCKIGNSVGVMIFAAVFFMYVSLANFNHPTEHTTGYKKMAH